MVNNHCSLNPFFLMHHVASVSPRYRSATNFFFFFRTTWHRAKVPDTLLCRSSTEFFFSHKPRGKEQKSSTHCSTGTSTEFLSFPRHLVAQSKCPPATHCSIGPRPNFLPFPRHFVAQQKSVTHHSIGSRPNPFFKMEIYAISWHKAKELLKLCNRSLTDTNKSSNDLI